MDNSVSSFYIRVRDPFKLNTKRNTDVNFFTIWHLNTIRAHLLNVAVEPRQGQMRDTNEININVPY